MLRVCTDFDKGSSIVVVAVVSDVAVKDADATFARNRKRRNTMHRCRIILLLILIVVMVDLMVCVIRYSLQPVSVPVSVATDLFLFP